MYMIVFFFYDGMFIGVHAQDAVAAPAAPVAPVAPAAPAAPAAPMSPAPASQIEVQPLKGETFRCRNPRVMDCAAKRLKILPAPRILERYPQSVTWVYNNYSISDRAYGPTAHQPNKYYFVVLAMLKNDAAILHEWLEHHIAHGVDHFFLVDDGSTDNTKEILKVYQAKGYVTLFDPPFAGLGYRQAAAYKNNLIKMMQENVAKWVAFLDLDEFLYSPKELDLKKILKNHEDLSSIGLSWMWFGSSGNAVNQPSIVQSNTKRLDFNNNISYVKLSDAFKILKHVSQKFIINTSFKVHNVDVHIVDLEGTEANLSDRANGTKSEIVINHYGVQSKDHYEKMMAKITEHHKHHEKIRPNRDFSVVDVNDIVDERLAIQNRVGMVRLKPKEEGQVRRLRA